jgi:hypothetical protein
MVTLGSGEILPGSEARTVARTALQTNMRNSANRSLEALRTGTAALNLVRSRNDWEPFGRNI